MKNSLRALHKVAEQGDNLMPVTMETVRAGATLAEVSGVIRQANGLPYDPYDMAENPFKGDL